MASLSDWQNFKGQDLVRNLKIEKNKNSKVGVFYFLSSTCPCSKGYFKYLNDLQKKFPQFSFMGFHSSKSISIEVAQKYFDKHEIEFPILFDKDLKYADMFKASKTPHVFVLNENGEVLYHGGVANSRMIKNAKTFYLEEVLTDLNENKKPRHSYARALGCYIAR